MKYIRLIRAKHHIKNLLVFLPLIFSGRLGERVPLLRTVWGFLAFSLLASAIYMINDIRDAPRDRLHPTKRLRPIAAGEVSVRTAWVLASLLVLLSAALHALCKTDVIGWLILALYLGLNLLYSFGLKNVPIVDIAILASGFLLRVLYGSAITGIEISKWLYLTVVSAAFYLGLGKRRNELRRQGDSSSRAVLEHYTQDFLDKNMYMCVALTIVFYSLWTVDSMTIARVGNSALIWTVPLVILIFMRYSLTVEGNSDGDPVEVLLSDKGLMAMGLLLAVAVLAIVYL